VRAYLCLFGDDTFGVVLYLVDSQNVVQIKISEPNTIANILWSAAIYQNHEMLATFFNFKNWGLRMEA